jgi:hypothetical protein
MGRDIERDSDPGAAEPQTELARAEGLPDPKLGAKMIRKHAPYAGLVVFETGPRATWLQRKRTADGFKAVGIAARQAIRPSIRRQTRQTPLDECIAMTEPPETLRYDPNHPERAPACGFPLSHGSAFSISGKITSR